MKLNRVSCAWLVGLVALMSGCLAPGPTVSQNSRLYDPPRSADTPTAVIVGTMQPGPLWIWGLTAFPFAVDNVRISEASARWNMPVVLSPGTRIITVEMSAHPYYARAEIELNAEPGHDYSVHFATDVLSRAGPTYCEFWLVDQITAVPASTLVRVNVLKKDV